MKWRRARNAPARRALLYRITTGAAGAQPNSPEFGRAAWPGDRGGSFGLLLLSREMHCLRKWLRRGNGELKRGLGPVKLMRRVLDVARNYGHEYCDYIYIYWKLVYSYHLYFMF